MKTRNNKWYLGFLGFTGFQGVAGIVRGDWVQAIWVVWFVWFSYFFIYSKGGESESLIDKQGKEKENRKQEILKLFENDGSLTNNEIETQLGISDATVARYMDELEKEGKVKQVGKTGVSVSYIKA